MAKKDNTLLYMGAATAGLLLLSKKSVGGIYGGSNMEILQVLLDQINSRRNYPMYLKREYGKISLYDNDNRRFFGGITKKEMEYFLKGWLSGQNNK
tara:strand:- start:917 stop:1204 length:288 start_codon:yes stop_codon:yes gene_type:complete